MSDRAIAGTLRATVTAGGALAVAGSVVFLSVGAAGVWVASFAGFGALLAVFFGVFVWLVSPGQPRNHVVWVMAASAVLAGIFVALSAAAVRAVAHDPGMVAVVLKTPVVPSSLPASAARIRMFSDNAGSVAFFGWLTFGLLLFPDGSLPSPRWRWVGALGAIGLATTVVGWAWISRPSSTQPNDSGVVFNVGLLMLMAVALLCLTALVGRFRKSTGTRRQQFKWMVWGASVFVPALIVVVAGGGPRFEGWLLGVFGVAEAVFLTAYGIAVGRYRLYDVDVVISRTVVYGALALFITGVYVVTVIGIGGNLGIDATSNRWLSIGATALVAFAFEPVRGRLQRLANRLVYGKRATPYEVLSDFSRNITATDEKLLQQVARSLAEGTTATGAAVWVVRDETLHRTADWPEGGDRGDVTIPVDHPIPDADLVEPVMHDGEYLGALTLSAARGQSLLPTDVRLVEQMASGMGLALRNIRLGEDLRSNVEELRRSRQRLVTVQDETRRHLERQLHDGAQQRLVALKVKLALSRRHAESSGVDEVAELLSRVADDTDRAIDSLRDFARGIYPPLLEAEGPAAALLSQVQKLPLEVTVHAAGVGRQPRPVEAALYFCVLEALQNVVKHAEASSAHVVLRESDGTVTFEVSDDGRGFDASLVEAGSGLANMGERLDALDGSLEVRSSPGGGTTVTGRVALRTAEQLV